MPSYQNEPCPFLIISLCNVSCGDRLTFIEFCVRVQTQDMFIFSRHNLPRNVITTVRLLLYWTLPRMCISLSGCCNFEHCPECVHICLVVASFEHCPECVYLSLVVAILNTPRMCIPLPGCCTFGHSYSLNGLLLYIVLPHTFCS